MSTVAVIEDHPRSVSVMDVRASSRFLSRTGVFFKKVSSFRSVHRKGEDRKGSGVYPRTSRSMDLHAMGSNKAFGMSQPILGVSTDHSMTDNDEQSDSTVSGSPTYTVPKAKHPEPPHPTPASQQQQPKPENTNANDASNNDATPRVPPAAGFPPASQTPSSRPPDGLPASDDQSWVLLEHNNKPTVTASGPPDSTHTPSTSTSIASNTTVTPITDGILADSGSHDSAQTFHSANDDLPVSSSQQSAADTADAPHDKPLPEAPTPLIDHPLPPPPPVSPPWKFNPSPRNPFVNMLDMSSPHARSLSLPSRNLLSPGSTPLQTPALPSINTNVGSPAAGSPETPISPSLHPRLASLPPPMAALYASQGSVRLTPSIGPRPTPMPIFNLPTLPLPTPRLPPTDAVTQSPARLRTMPALPLRGPSETGGDGADHENAALDEMEDVDEMEEDGEADGDGDDEMPSDHVSDNEDNAAEVEVPTMGHRLRSPLPPSLSRSPRASLLPPVDTSPFDINWRVSPASDVERPGTQYFTPTDPAPPLRLDVSRTPAPMAHKPQQGTDYFSSKQPEPRSPSPDTTRTPRPGDFGFDFGVPRTVPMPSQSPRPGLYHQGSKSMVDLLSMSRQKDGEEPSVGEMKVSRVPDAALATRHDAPQSPVAGPSTSADEQVPKTPTIRRQRSLPMYTMATEPPPYPSFMPYAPPLVAPREEEGREQLPHYTNSIYLVAVMPRKMEFSAPGFQSKDRKWKRALCVLEGTVFKVYRVHGSVVEDWWERTVGVGDRTTVDPFTVGAAGTIRVSGLRGTERALERPSKGDGSPTQAAIDASEAPASSSGGAMPACPVRPPPSRSRLQLAASLLHPSRSTHHQHRLGDAPSANSRSRLSFDVPRESGPAPAGALRRQSTDSSRSGPSTSGSPSASPGSRMQRNNSSDTSPSPSTTLNPSSSAVSRQSSTTLATSHFGSTTSCCYLDQEPDPKDLVRAYTLQNAESGLASDYVKRKNVIRVRMEGEQFLLQAKDVPAVIEWIEGIQAATNIALDLDERPMPKGPIFPRRRRRRNRPRTGEASGTATAAASSSSRPAEAH